MPPFKANLLATDFWLKRFRRIRNGKFKLLKLGGKVVMQFFCKLIEQQLIELLFVYFSGE
jgi:hypothetical protein